MSYSYRGSDIVKVYFEPHGCALSYGEATMLQELIERKHCVVQDPEDADVIVLMTCIVIESTEQRMLNRINAIVRAGQRVLVAGCLPAALPERVPTLEGVAIFNCDELEAISQHIMDIARVYKKAAHSSRTTLHTVPERVRMREPQTRPVHVNIPIATGCIGHCSYCITKVARGGLRSYDIAHIVQRVRARSAQGCSEIRLCAQDTGCYGRDIGSSLPVLIRNLTALDGAFRVRIGMMNPNSALAVLDELLDAYDDEKVYKFVHLPVQSGDETVLDAMNRRYTIADFKTVVNSFRRAFPDIMLATDVIAGYPGESVSQFENSCKLIADIAPDIVNIKGFSPRPKTPAAQLKRSDGALVRSRTRRLAALAERVCAQALAKQVGKRDRVLLVERGKHGTIVGRTSCYRPVVLNEYLATAWGKPPHCPHKPLSMVVGGRSPHSPLESLLGSFIDVEITDAKTTYLLGTRLKAAIATR